MTTNLEGTPEFQRGFDAVCPDVEGKDPSPYSRQHGLFNLTNHIMQSVVGETPYQNVNLEDEMWHAIFDLEETNGLPEGVRAEDVYQCYLNVFHRDEG